MSQKTPAANGIPIYKGSYTTLIIHILVYSPLLQGTCTESNKFICSPPTRLSFQGDLMQSDDRALYFFSVSVERHNVHRGSLTYATTAQWRPGHSNVRQGNPVYAWAAKRIPEQPKVQQGYHRNVRGAKYEDSPVHKRATKGTSEQFTGTRLLSKRHDSPVSYQDSPLYTRYVKCRSGQRELGQRSTRLTTRCASEHMMSI